MNRVIEESIRQDISSLVKIMTSPNCSKRYALDLKLDDGSKALVLYSNATEGNLNLLNIIISREEERDETK